MLFGILKFGTVYSCILYNISEITYGEQDESQANWPFGISDIAVFI